MFWFEISEKTCPNFNKEISIHHMFWFEYSDYQTALNKAIFQYIICFGSSKTKRGIET